MAIGNKHEQRVLGEYRAAGNLVEIPRASVFDRAALQAAATPRRRPWPRARWSTRLRSSTASSSATPTSSSGPRTGWRRLRREAGSARQTPGAAAARRLRRPAPDQLGLPVAPIVSLLLGNGERVDFAVADILPVFQERRDRLRRLLTEHRAIGNRSSGVTTGSSRADSAPSATHAARQPTTSPGRGTADGSTHENACTNRRRSRPSPISPAATKPDGMAQATFEKPQAASALQWAQVGTPGASTCTS